MNYTGNDPAYPSTDGTGLTKRELFAAMCLQGIMSQAGLGNPDMTKQAARLARFAADALLAELELTA